MFIDFREGARGKEKERNIDQLPPVDAPTNQESKPQPRYVP